MTAHHTAAAVALDAAKQHPDPTVDQLIAAAHVHALLDLADAIRQAGRTTITTAPREADA